MRKETSTNFINEQQIRESCPMALTISLLSGRWKPTILYKLQHFPLRYMDLKKQIPQATERILVRQLQELEKDYLIIKTTEAGTPVKVTYSLSAVGESLIPLLKQVETWGNQYKAAHLNP